MHRRFHCNTAVRWTIQAAEGWLTLGAPSAALEELETLAPVLQEYPTVLHERARVLVALGRVDRAKETIRYLAKLAPARRLALLDDPALAPLWR